MRHGVLGLELLAAQAHAFGRPGADTNTEHYQAAALHSFLTGRETLTDTELRRLMQIGEVEKRTARGSHVFYELVHRDVLSEAQLEIVAEACQEASIQRLPA